MYSFILTGQWHNVDKPCLIDLKLKVNTLPFSPSLLPNGLWANMLFDCFRHTDFHSKSGNSLGGYFLRLQRMVWSKPYYFVIKSEEWRGISSNNKTLFRVRTLKISVSRKMLALYIQFNSFTTKLTSDFHKHPQNSSI